MIWKFRKKEEEKEQVGFNVDELQKALQKTAEGVGELTLEIVGIDGRIDLLSKKVDREAQMFKELQGNATSMQLSNQTVNDSVSQTQDVIIRAIDNIGNSKNTINNSIRNIKDLSETVTESGIELEKLSSALKQVKKITSTIASISKQTNLLALNATIEASRAGEAGRGFAVVAEEVKSLSKKASEATTEISHTVNSLADQIVSLVDMSKTNTEKAALVKDDAEIIGSTIDLLENDINAIDENSSKIVTAATEIDHHCNDTVEGLNNLTEDVDEANESFAKARARINALRASVETIVRHTLVKGIETVDTPIVNLCQDLAKRTSEFFEKSIDEGLLTQEDFFDFDYKEIPGTNPIQYETRFVNFCDKYMPGIQEPALENKRIATCTATDINGFIPRHVNARHNPQKPGDVTWNNLNCRSMRIYNDPSGLNAAKNTKDFLLQTYRIPYLGGQYAVLKDCSAPIYINGKHWGCMRLTYDIKVTDEEGNDIMQSQEFQDAIKQDKAVSEGRVKLDKE